MSDNLVEAPTRDINVQVDQDTQGEFAKVIRLFETDLRSNGAVTLNELLDHVLDLEAKYEDRLSDEELAVLGSLSLLLGISKKMIKAETSTPKLQTEITKNHLEAIGVQREIAGIILTNLDSNGKPKPEISRFYRIVAGVFEDYFNPENPKLEDAGIERKAGVFQGILGMTATAFLFKNAGYEIRYPPPQYDLEHEVDLLVRDREGKIYAVDITARTPRPTGEGEVGSAFSLGEKSGYPSFLKEKLGF